jgi:hypothetical protein
MSIVNFLMTFLCSALAASSLCTAMPVLHSMDFPQEKKAEEKEFLGETRSSQSRIKIFN